MNSSSITKKFDEKLVENNYWVGQVSQNFKINKITKMNGIDLKTIGWYICWDYVNLKFKCIQ